MSYSRQLVAQLTLLRRSLTSVLLTLPVDVKGMSVEALIGMIDHFQQHPNEYTELANERRKYEEKTHVQSTELP